MSDIQIDPYLNTGYQQAPAPEEAPPPAPEEAPQEEVQVVEDTNSDYNYQV